MTIVFIVNTPRRCFPQIFLLCAKVTENFVIFYHFWGCQNRHKNLQIRSSIIFQFSPAHHPRSFVYVSKINLACFNMNRKEKNFIVRIISILFVYIFMRIWRSINWWMWIELKEWERIWRMQIGERICEFEEIFGMKN